MNSHKVDFSLKAWDSPTRGVRIKVHKGSDVQLRLVEFAQGFVDSDWCRRGHVGYVLDGRLKVTFSGSEEVFEAGDGVFIPEGIEHKHKARVLSDHATLILVERAGDPGV
jgi:quercetin dioxygenase-like cupin family protein